VIRGSDSWLVLDGPRAVAVRIASRPRCTGCGGAALATLQVTRRGYSCGTDYEHAPECPALACHHGVSFIDECKQCEQEDQNATSGRR
jgi:hypothetical protein